MDVKGAYTTIGDFLHTYKECTIISNFTTGKESEKRWSFEENRTLKIPDYQREYKWGQKQLEDLYNDFQENNGYLGQIAVSHKIGEKTYYIVDGQQRITSIMILVAVLVRQFFIHKDDLNISEYELNKKEYNQGHSVSKTSFETNCFSSFQSFISKIYEDQTPDLLKFEPDFFDAPTTDEYIQSDTYIEACSVLNELLMKSLSIIEYTPQKLEKIKNMLDSILQTRISVVVFEGNVLGESERIFLDINEKGLKLDNEDILKAYYFRNVRLEDLALSTWKNIKTNYFKLRQSIGGGKNSTSLDCFMNFALQVALFSDVSSSYDFDKFDNDLHYGPSNKKHICQLFTNTALQNSFKKTVCLFDTITNLIEYVPNSPYYSEYLSGCDSTTRQIFSLLFTTTCKADMKIVFIVLAKLWWIRKNNEQKLTFDDVIQLFSFYIICNISGLKKEKSIISESFIKALSIEQAYNALFDMERNLLSESSEKSLTLKRDQEKAEYLSFNIQMFYNDFRFDTTHKHWTISISNQEFLDKYSSNRRLYIKDHILIQNGNTIRLMNGNDYTINQSMKMLKKRAYNFVYHKDVFGNIDFVSRLEKIHTADQSQYGAYEHDYFEFVQEQFLDFYKQDGRLPSWSEAIETYKNNAQRDFPEIVSFILQERSPSWNRKIGSHISAQFSTT